MTQIVKIYRINSLINYSLGFLLKSYLPRYSSRLKIIKFSNFTRNCDRQTINFLKLFSTSSCVPQKCWRCDNNVVAKDFFCSKCSAIQKPSKDSDFYQLLGIPCDYVIDENNLTNKFRKTQMLLHPDKFSSQTKEEQAIAEDYSSLVNKAYRTLRHPWSRGVYLLRRLGVEFNEETTVDDPELLMEVMERNEEVAEANSLFSLKKSDKKNKLRVNEAVVAISKAFSNKDLDLAKSELVKLKYFINIDAKIRERKLEFGATE